MWRRTFNFSIKGFGYLLHYAQMILILAILTIVRPPKASRRFQGKSFAKYSNHLHPRREYWIDDIGILAFAQKYLLHLSSLFVSRGLSSTSPQTHFALLHFAKMDILFSAWGVKELCLDYTFSPQSGAWEYEFRSQHYVVLGGNFHLIANISESSNVNSFLKIVKNWWMNTLFSG